MPNGKQRGTGPSLRWRAEDLRTPTWKLRRGALLKRLESLSPKAARQSRLRKRTKVAGRELHAGRSRGADGRAADRAVHDQRARDAAADVAATGRASRSGLAAIVRVDRDVVVRQVAGPHRGLAGAEAEVDADARSRGPACRRPRSSRRRSAPARRPWPPRGRRSVIDRRSRSAASPALPTAITTRPQLGSPPAIAVLTSGELAMEKPIRRAAASLSAPVTSICDQLGQALAVLHHPQAPARASGRAARRRTPARPRSPHP